MSQARIEEIDNYEANADEMLVDSNMIPAVQMEVVMTRDGHVEEEYPPASPNYQYDYSYDDQEMSQYDNNKLLPVALAQNQPPEKEDWRVDQKLRMDLYEVLDALPPHMHEKYIKMFEKRGVVLDSKKLPSVQQEYIYQQQQQQNPAPKNTRQYYYNYGTAYKGPIDRGGDYRNSQFSKPYGYEVDVDDYGNGGSAGDGMYGNNDTPGKANPSDRLCPGCSMVLRRSVFYHHARMIRERGACNLFTPQRFPCPHCEQKLGTLEKLCHHLEQIHEAPTQIKTEIFGSELEFNNFRTELEGKGGNFRMARGNKKNKKGIVQYFRCNRLQTLSKNQTFRLVDNPLEGDLPSNKRRGRLVEKPSGAKQVVRTENSCTAFYNKAYLDNGTIEVRYCDHHLHDDERLRLPEPVRMRVIDLARKQLPHLVVLMIVKDERYKYCERNSANDRRISDMKTQDIRQILAGNNRQERTRVRRGGVPRNRIQLVDNGDGVLVPREEDPNSDWVDVRAIPTQRVNRTCLTAVERRYLDLFDTNREEVMHKINDRAQMEMEKRTIFESFVHRATSANNLMKKLDFTKIIPTEHHYMQLEKALEYIERMQEVIATSRKEPKGDFNQTFLSMMEEKNRELMMHRRGERVDDIDVVGIDAEPYLRGSTKNYQQLGRMGVYTSHEEEMEQLELQRAVLDVDDEDDDNYLVPLDHNPPSMSLAVGKKNKKSVADMKNHHLMENMRVMKSVRERLEREELLRRPHHEKDLINLKNDELVYDTEMVVMGQEEEVEAEESQDYYDAPNLEEEEEEDEPGKIEDEEEEEEVDDDGQGTSSEKDGAREEKIGEQEQEETGAAEESEMEPVNEPSTSTAGNQRSIRTRRSTRRNEK